MSFRRVPAPLWTWECNTEAEICEKFEYNSSVADQTPQLSYETCRIACGKTGRLWPVPTGTVNVTTLVARVSPSKFEMAPVQAPSQPAKNAVLSSYQVFKERVAALARPNAAGEAVVDDGYVGIDVTVRVESSSLDLGHETNESYSLHVAPSRESDLAVEIRAATFYGARHAFETLFQLIAYDEYCTCYTMVSSAHVSTRLPPNFGQCPNSLTAL
jgi:hexosaminidase